MKTVLVERPDNKVTVDFLGGCTVQLELTDAGIYVCITDKDDRATIILDKRFPLS